MNNSNNACNYHYFFNDFDDNNGHCTIAVIVIDLNEAIVTVLITTSFRMHMYLVSVSLEDVLSSANLPWAGGAAQPP